MGKFSYFLVFSIGLISSPQLVLASQESLQPLTVINIPAETPETKFIYNRKESALSQESFSTANDINKKSNGKLCSLSKKFGPLDLGLKVNPFNFNNTGLVVGLDLLRSYEILSSSSNLTELTEAFKPDPNQHIINHEMKSIMGKILVSINDKLNPLSNPDLKVQ